MANLIINFVKKTYKILIVLLAAVIFFLGYNTYLVDRSLANLRVTLDKVSDVKTLEDATKLASALDYSLLTEVGSRQLQASSISKIELAKEILSKPEDLSQLKDVKFVLEEVVKQKEKKRPAILVVLDKVTQIFAPTLTKIPKVKLEEQASYIKERLNTIRDINELQAAHYELANIYTRLSEFAKAKEAYQKAIDLNPRSNLANKSRFNLAWNEKYQGNLDEAIKEFESLSQVAGEENLAIFSKYQMAEVYRKKGDYEKAALIYKEIAEEARDKDLAQLAEFRVGYTYLYDLKDYVKAKEAFDESKILFEGSTIAAHIEDTATSSIVAQYRKIGFELLKEGYELSVTGKYKKEEVANKYKEALKYFDRALEIAPEDGISYIGKALGFLWLNDPDRAFVLARKSVKLLPDNEVASVNLGYIYIKLGLVDEAVIEYKRFIKVAPFSASGYYNLGYAYTIQNRLGDAIVAFQQATEINPRFAFAFNNKGWCLWQLSRYAEATVAFEKAIQINPNFLDALFNLGLLYKTLGRYEEAKGKFETILKTDAVCPEAYNQLKEVEKIIKKREKKQ